jgi:Terminase large subunit, T4likevirus-type, N-terminal
MQAPNISKADALFQVWKKGFLTYKLDPFQKDLVDQINNSKEKVNVVLSSRRLGKSYAATIMAFMQCFSKPNSIVKFLSPTKLMVNSNLRAVIKQILTDCPEELQPFFKKSDFIYYFPNGSELQLAGSDSGHADKLRGGFADLCIVDEGQMCDGLMDVVRSVLIPTTMNTKGKIVIVGTPPKDFEHDFIKFVEEAEAKGTLIKKTIFDNSRITKDEIDSIIAAYPLGVNDPEFRREFLCELSRDPSLTVISEFTPEIEKEIVRDWPKPPHFDTYEAMDLGFKDMTVVLFSYWDFRANKLIIEDEIALQGNDVQLPKLIESIKQKEEQLWMNIYINEVKTPHMRVSDINYIVTEEINRASGGKIYFTNARKDDKEAAINNLRVMIEAKKIIINPKCKVLINHLKHAKWQKRKDVRLFARSVDGSHYDAVDALIYLTRHVDYNKNPYPRDYGLNLTKENSYYTPSYTENPQIQAFQKLFGIKKRGNR